MAVQEGELPDCMTPKHNDEPYSDDEEDEQSRDDEDVWGDDTLESVEEIVRPEVN